MANLWIMSMEEFEEKREKWVKEIRETDHPILHIESD